MNRRVWAEVKLHSIACNVQAIRRRLPASCRFMAAVKAGGYGHGLVESAGAVLAAGADELAVSNLDEGLQLRAAGIQAPVLALTPIRPDQAGAAAQAGIAVPVFQAAQLAESLGRNDSGKPLRVHVKFDTGMGRIGVRERSEFEALAPLLRWENCRVEGAYTHYATANQADPAYYREQIRRFAAMREWLAAAGFGGVPVHGANSAAALRFPADSLDMVRVGAALYGIHTCDREVREEAPVRLLPAMAVHSEIMSVKRLRQGEALGYDRSHRAEREEWIATVPIGYADGLFRGFKGFPLLVDGHRCPIVGNVCMDQLMIRLPGPYPIGTRVTLLGSSGGRANTLEDLADYIGTIPQQVLTMLSDRIPRLYEDAELELDGPGGREWPASDQTAAAARAADVGQR